ncbi:unnamed protein product [Lactuca virosa]|uniref:Uncharacterized protein n=1 Tax=Lactuca virosa TaxID=75947 RepID=A0AAU9NMT1_9ASTR|nr:unnamed protein product [Lactuca virosa]
MYNKKLKQKFIKRTKLKEDDPLVVEHVLSDDKWIAAPSDGEEDGGVIGSARGGRAIGRPRGGGTIGEGSGTRKRKNVQVNLIDEDDGMNLSLTCAFFCVLFPMWLFFEVLDFDVLDLFYVFECVFL